MPESPQATNVYLAIGRIIAPHGIRGEVKVEVLTDFPERFKPGTHVFLGAGTEDPEAKPASLDDESLRMQSKLLEKKLEDFGVNGQVVAVSPGPVVTTYEYEPAPGVKINKVASLSDDLSLALRATSIRIVAPIPGKAVIGIEIPNPNHFAGGNL